MFGSLPNESVNLADFFFSFKSNILFNLSFNIELEG